MFEKFLIPIALFTFASQACAPRPNADWKAAFESTRPPLHAVTFHAAQTGVIPTCMIITVDKVEVLYQPAGDNSMGWFFQGDVVEVRRQADNWQFVYGPGMDGARHLDAPLSGWVRELYLAPAACPTGD